MSEYRTGEPGQNRESRYTAEILEQAMAIARQIMAEPETPVRSFVYGQQGGELYVSSDAELVVGTETVTVDGQTFYIGIFLRS